MLLLHRWSKALLQGEIRADIQRSAGDNGNILRYSVPAKVMLSPVLSIHAAKKVIPKLTGLKKINIYYFIFLWAKFENDLSESF